DQVEQVAGEHVPRWGVPRIDEVQLAHHRADDRGDDPADAGHPPQQPPSGGLFPARPGRLRTRPWGLRGPICDSHVLPPCSRAFVKEHAYAASVPGRVCRHIGQTVTMAGPGGARRRRVAPDFRRCTVSRSTDSRLAVLALAWAHGGSWTANQA